MEGHHTREGYHRGGEGQDKMDGLHTREGYHKSGKGQDTREGEASQ